MGTFSYHQSVTNCGQLTTEGKILQYVRNSHANIPQIDGIRRKFAEIARLLKKPGR